MKNDQRRNASRLFTRGDILRLAGVLLGTFGLAALAVCGYAMGTAQDEARNDALRRLGERVIAAAPMTPDEVRALREPYRYAALKGLVQGGGEIAAESASRWDREDRCAWFLFGKTTETSWAATTDHLSAGFPLLPTETCRQLPVFGDVKL
jgi:hypothetical protein